MSQKQGYRQENTAKLPARSLLFAVKLNWKLDQSRNISRLATIPHSSLDHYGSKAE